MKTSIGLGLCGLGLLFSCACNAVVSKHPVGETPAKITASKWQGQWLGGQGQAKIEVVDAEKGLLKVTWTERGDNESNSATIELRESDSWLFANTKDWDKDPSTEYVWARVRNEDRQIIIWLPEVAAFKKLVLSGTLPGKMRSSDVVLDELTPRHLKILTGGTKGQLLEWDKPGALVKVED